MTSNGIWEKGNTTPKQHAKYKKHLSSDGTMFDPVDAFLQAGTSRKLSVRPIELHAMIRAGQTICQRMLAEQLDFADVPLPIRRVKESDPAPNVSGRSSTC